MVPLLKATVLQDMQGTVSFMKIVIGRAGATYDSACINIIK